MNAGSAAVLALVLARQLAGVDEGSPVRVWRLPEALRRLLPLRRTAGKGRGQFLTDRRFWQRQKCKHKVRHN